MEAASDYLPAVQDMADLDIDALAPIGARWPDPPLTTLVTMLVPMTLARIGLPALPVGRVVDIVRIERRWKLKNPAPIAGG